MAVLSISRQFGAGGRTLGEKVALELDYLFLHEATLDKLAQAAVREKGASVQGFYSDAHITSILSSVGPADFLEHYMGEANPKYFERSHIEALSELMEELANLDKVVFLGRGSQFILRNHPLAIRVLLVAELEDRMEFMTRRYHLKKDKAHSIIKKADKKRARFLRLFFPREPNEVTLYHLVLNTSLMPLDMAQAQIVKLVREFGHGAIELS